MTHQQQTAFRCDRCGDTEIVPHNTQPGLDRGQPPGSWLTLYLRIPTNSPQHLCPSCTSRFDSFMEQGHAG